VPFATLNNVWLHYEEQGEGPPLLLLHNYFGTLEAWGAQREALNRHFRVIVADARGHGRTQYPGGRLRLTDFAEDISQLINFLDIAPTHLVGSSLGAQIGLHLAREEPRLVRTLAAVDPPHLSESTTQAYMDRVAQLFPANEGRLESEHSGQRTGHVRSVLLRNFMLDKEEIPSDQMKIIDLAESISCPTLIVGGDNDPVFPIRRALELWEKITGSELFILPRAGHFPHHTMPHVFNEVLLRFLHRWS
jgi:3-oxoadipate enol-lactonase